MIVQKMKIEVTRADIASTDGGGRQSPFLAIESALRREFPGKSFDVTRRHAYRMDIDDPEGTPLPKAVQEWITNGVYGPLAPISFDLTVWW